VNFRRRYQDLLGEHYNEHRPHRSLSQRPPLATDELRIEDVSDLDRVRRRDLLGGLIHEYDLAA
jgi:putative transposase